MAFKQSFPFPDNYVIMQLESLLPLIRYVQRQQFYRIL